MTHPWFAASETPRILAHRGFVPPDAEGIVENTAAAVAAAHAAGARYVESDCHLTADGVPVLFHDDDLTRVTGDPRPVAELSLHELERIMSSRGGLLTVGDALSAFPTLRFNLDVKADAVAEPTGRAVAREADRVLLTSFSDARRRAALAAARAEGGEPATSAGRETIVRVLGGLAARSSRAVARALDGIDALQIPERFPVPVIARRRGVPVLSSRLIRAAHEAGVEVHVWTVDDAPQMHRLLDLGVDGIVTDRTDVGLAVAAARRS